MTYIAQFWGRQVAAIGTFHNCTVQVEAKDLEEAKLRLYDTHEHITHLRWTVLKVPASAYDPLSHDGVKRPTSDGTAFTPHGWKGATGCYRCNGNGPCRDCG